MNYKIKKQLINFKRKSNLAGGKLIASYLDKYNYESIDKLTDADFVMAGYPKSGNTWMQNLLAGVIYGIDTKFLPDSLAQEVIPDLDYKLFYKRFTKSMCFKTHDYPDKNFKNVIHLVRNPKDVMASYFAMMYGRGKVFSPEETIIEGKNLLFGDWATHSQAWIDNPFNAKKLIVKYEDLLVKPLNEMKRILSFMSIERPDEVIQRAIDGNSLQLMKKKEKEFGFDKRFIRPENWKEGHTFVRNGKKESAKKELSTELIEYINKQCKDQMDYFGYS